MDEDFADFGNGQLDGEWLPGDQEAWTSRSVWLYGTARMDGVRGDEAMKVGRGIRVGGLEGGSRKAITNNQRIAR